MSHVLKRTPLTATLRRYWLSSLLGIVALAVTSGVQAFTIHPSTWFPSVFEPVGDNSFRDFGAPNHELITLCGLDRALGVAGTCSLSNYSTLTPFQGALLAAVIRPNYDDFSNPDANQTAPHHFDDSRIAQGAAYVQEQWTRVINTIENLVGGVVLTTKSSTNTVVQVATRVIEELGRLIHATQDFYAHTNYVETQALLMRVAPGLWDGATFTYQSGVGASAVSVALGSGRYPGAPLGASGVGFPAGGVVTPASALSSLPALANFRLTASGTLPASAATTSHAQIAKDSAISVPGALRFSSAVPAISGLTMFQVAHDLAIAQTQSDLTQFLNLVVGDPVSGFDLLDYWTTDPDFLRITGEFLATFDPSNPQSWAQFDALAAVDMPEPGTAALATLGLILLLLLARKRLPGIAVLYRSPRSARSSPAAPTRPSA